MIKLKTIMLGIIVILIIAGVYLYLSADDEWTYHDVDFDKDDTVDETGDDDSSSSQDDDYEDDWYEDESPPGDGDQEPTEQSNLKMQFIIHYTDGTSEAITRYHAHSGLLSAYRTGKIVESVEYKSYFRLDPEYYSEYRLQSNAMVKWQICDDAFDTPMYPVYIGEKTVSVFPTAGGNVITGDWQYFANLAPLTMEDFSVSQGTLAPGTYKLWLELRFTVQLRLKSTGNWQNARVLTILPDYIEFEHLWD
jgi:hypothetical protein